MTARTFLVRGLLAGLVAGLLTFAVAYAVGEPSVDAAVALEETRADPATSAHAPDEIAGHAPDETAGHAHGSAGHSHADDGGGVSRTTQRTWGLATATVAVSVALGGVVALVAAGVAGRLGRLSVAGSTALVAALGYLAFALVPFLKYPAAPPAVGSADTIGERTGYYFAFVLVSLAAVVAAVAAARALAPRWGGYWATILAGAGYVAVVAVAAVAMPVVDELGDFPADVLWDFRLGSLLTLTTMWLSLGVALTAMLRPLADARAARRLGSPARPA